MKVLKRKAREMANRAGYDVVPLDMSTAIKPVLRRCIGIAGPINTVIDVGASDGQWSRMVMGYLPDARYLLLDPQPSHAEALVAMKQETGADFVVAAASDRAGTLHFHDDRTNIFGGSASHRPFASNDSVVDSVTIDGLVQERDLSGPFLLKLDTHGHEREILAGARDVVASAAIVVLETYAFSEVSGFTFDEMCEHMRGLGFRPAAIADVLTRADGVLWQADIVFLPATHAAFAHTKYAVP